MTANSVLRALAASIETAPGRWPARGEPAPADVAGYQDGDWVYVLAATMSAASDGQRAPLAALRDAGHLATEPGRPGALQVQLPRWARGQVASRAYKVRLSALAAPPDDPPEIGQAPIGSDPRPRPAGPAGWPWGEDRPPREPAAEDCPDCGGPAARTPQGTLTDCPACGLVLTAGCRQRAEVAGRREVAKVAARPDIDAEFAARLAGEAHARECRWSADTCQEWAALLSTPDALTGDEARQAATLADGFRVAARMCSQAATPAELDEIRMRITGPLISCAEPLEEILTTGTPRELAEYEDDPCDALGDDVQGDDASEAEVIPLRPRKVVAGYVVPGYVPPDASWPRAPRALPAPQRDPFAQWDAHANAIARATGWQPVSHPLGQPPPPPALPPALPPLIGKSGRQARKAARRERRQKGSQ